MKKRRSERWRYAGKKADPFYLSPAWRAARIRILQRDFYWCQVCKRRTANTVHHKIPRSERPDLELEESNLEAVCERCHNADHPEKGRKSRQHELPEKPDLSGIRVIKV